MSGNAHITPCYGVDNVTPGGSQQLRRIAYRAHCGVCGWLGPKRRGYRHASQDVTGHNRGGCHVETDRERWYGG